MATQLKLNSLHFQASLQKDKDVLENVEEKMGGNLDVMSKERGRLGAYERKGSWTTCYVIIAVAMVACAWVFMFAVMRVTPK